MENLPSTLPALTLPNNHSLRASPPHIQSWVEKEEMASPVSSSEGSNNPGLLGSQVQPAWSGGSSTRNQDLQLPKRRPTAVKRYQCSGDGCRLACRSMKELLGHMQVHYRPTESLEGHSSNSRIVWEHTRGRYNCLQCPYSTASREEMTQHIEDHRKNPSPTSRLDGEMDFGVPLPSFHPKLTPEVENSLFSPL